MISISWLKITECAHEDEKQAECTSMRLLTDLIGCNVPLRSRLLGESAGGVMTTSIFSFTAAGSTTGATVSTITVKSTHGELFSYIITRVYNIHMHYSYYFFDSVYRV